MSLERIMRRVLKPDSGCWEWQGATSAGGYGVSWSAGKASYVHRLVFEWVRGAIPPGLVLDHLCRNRRCCNPEHLEPVSDAVNLLRGSGAPAKNAKKTACHRGHLLSGSNLYLDRDGWRRCVECRRSCARAQWQRTKEQRKEAS